MFACLHMCFRPHRCGCCVVEYMCFRPYNTCACVFIDAVALWFLMLNVVACYRCWLFLLRTCVLEFLVACYTCSCVLTCLILFPFVR